MLFHCLPNLVDGDNAFDFTMRSVCSAHNGLCKAINDKSLLDMDRIKQNKNKQIRYSRNSDFTDKIADEFLSRNYVVKDNIKEYPNY